MATSRKHCCQGAALGEACDWSCPTQRPVALVRSEDKPVPVEVRMMVWVNRQGWSAEHGLDVNDDFEDSVKDWVRAECQELVDNDEWSNVERVTE